MTESDLPAGNIDRFETLLYFNVKMFYYKVNGNQKTSKRESQFEMINVEQALKIIHKICFPLGRVKKLEITQAVNCILAEDVFSPEPHPPFRASIKDGYAVKG